MTAYFVTSSGTDVGKTFATCALIHAARAQGKTVAAFKPILSGFEAASATDSDAGKIMEALGAGTIDGIAPWRFPAPLSPNMAAAREGKTIDVDAVIRWTHERLHGADITFIEGVGGVLVPLNDTHTVRDWMVGLSIPAIVVVGSYLGAISHALTAIEALRVANISIKALIVSESEDSTVSLTETFETLRVFTADIPLRIAQPRVSSPQHATAIHSLLERLC